MARVKPKFISIASPIEPAHSRVVQGVPPNPIPQTIWVAGESCELITFPTNATGNLAPTINLQGTTTTLTGPRGSDFSLTVAVDLDANGDQYAMNFAWQNVPGTDVLWSIPIFAAGATGDVAPIRNIQGSNTGFDAIKAQWGSSNPKEPGVAGLCIDGTGQIYAGISDTILRFPAGSDGNATGTIFLQDTATFGQSHGGASIGGITSLCFDPVRQWIWVSYYGPTHPKAGVNAYNLSGAVQRSITGTNTTFFEPTQVAISPVDGSIWVGDIASQIISFAPTANGNIAPIVQITYPVSSNLGQIGVAIGNTGTIFAAIVSTDASPSHVVSYAAGTNGLLAPTLTDISGDLTVLDQMLDGTSTFPEQIVVK